MNVFFKLKYAKLCDAVWPMLTRYGVESIAGNYDIAIGRGSAH